MASQLRDRVGQPSFWLSIGNLDTGILRAIQMPEDERIQAITERAEQVRQFFDLPELGVIDYITPGSKLGLWVSHHVTDHKLHSLGVRLAGPRGHS